MIWLSGVIKVLNINPPLHLLPDVVINPHQVRPVRHMEALHHLLLLCCPTKVSSLRLTWCRSLGLAHTGPDFSAVSNLVLDMKAATWLLIHEALIEPSQSKSLSLRKKPASDLIPKRCRSPVSITRPRRTHKTLNSWNRIKLVKFWTMQTWCWLFLCGHSLHTGSQHHLQVFHLSRVLPGDAKDPDHRHEHVMTPVNIFVLYFVSLAFRKHG